eukprot:12707466-Ditylum_brightwellii.AAC.1
MQSTTGKIGTTMDMNTTNVKINIRLADLSYDASKGSTNKLADEFIWMGSAQYSKIFLSPE